MKICSKCGAEIPLSNFFKCSTSPDGYHRWCKECMKQYNRDRRSGRSMNVKRRPSTIIGDATDSLELALFYMERAFIHIEALKNHCDSLKDLAFPQEQEAMKQSALLVHRDSERVITELKNMTDTITNIKEYSNDHKE